MTNKQSHVNSTSAVSRFTSAWAEARYAQRRLDNINRPWISMPRRSS